MILVTAAMAMARVRRHEGGEGRLPREAGVQREDHRWRNNAATRAPPSERLGQRAATVTVRRRIVRDSAEEQLLALSGRERPVGVSAAYRPRGEHDTRPV